jgi:chromosome segregation ATPase
VKYQERKDTYEGLRNNWEAIRKERKYLNDQRIAIFSKGIRELSHRIGEIYLEMTRGGTATLDPV